MSMIFYSIIILNVPERLPFSISERPDPEHEGNSDNEDQDRQR